MIKSADLAYPDALPPNTRLQCYLLDRVLGQGGFAITYLARDTYLDQPVAIKEYLPIEVAQRGADETVVPRTVEQRDRYRWGLNRFLFEARTLARFDHPNIVRVLSVFEQNGTAYMVMRYENGDNLSALLDKRHALPEPQLLGILLPILEGIELVHEANFVHRDIKPSNIYIRDDDSPVLLDFGSARQALGQPRTMTVLVTSGYTPFEQYQSDTCGPWTDIYSLGATCYRAVSGSSPVDALARVKSSLGSLDDPLVPARVAGQGRYSESLLAAIDHALRISEKERPQTVRQWREEITALNSAKPHRPAVASPPRHHPSPIAEAAPARQQSPIERPVGAVAHSHRWTNVIWVAAASGLLSAAAAIAWMRFESTTAAPVTPVEVGSHPTPVPPPPANNSQVPALVAAPEASNAVAELPVAPRRSEPAPARPNPPDRAVQTPRPTMVAASAREPLTARHEVAAPLAPTPVVTIPASVVTTQAASVAAPGSRVTTPAAGVTTPAIAVAALDSAASAPRPNPPAEASAAPPATIETAAFAPPAPGTGDRAGGRALKDKVTPPRPRAPAPAGTPADDEALAAAGDADASLRAGERYAAGRNGYPNHFFAYVYFKLAVLGGRSDAAAKMSEQAQKLQPPEIRQADAQVDSLRRTGEPGRGREN